MANQISRFFLALFLSFILAPQALSLADIDLPPPQTEGGIGVFEALKKRSSAAGGDFSLAQVSLEELSTVLWAATGLNREGTGWTVPMAEGLPPYIKVYVAGNQGVFLYDPKNHKLLEISQNNIKASIGSQAFVGKAFYILIFVTDPAGLKKLRNQNSAEEFAAVLTGAMTQNIYLAAASLRLGTRYIHSMKISQIKTSLNLSDEEKPLALMLLGK
ncbi:MAG: SagB/ThcOx family dehydrogenase [Deltaproteobacteria bacterium]|jgi:SagB-type dehydrogenase family enzyme|nr:SagB/ThcOx family dehydrogenase [Deltaproteobacteria bacterium]